MHLLFAYNAIVNEKEVFRDDEDVYKRQALNSYKLKSKENFKRKQGGKVNGNTL